MVPKEREFGIVHPLKLFMDMWATQQIHITDRPGSHNKDKIDGARTTVSSVYNGI